MRNIHTHTCTQSWRAFALSSAMEGRLQMEMVPTFRVTNCKAEWKVQANELIEINGIRYVELKRGKAHQFGFARLVYNVLGLEDKCWSLASSIGYSELQKMRNEAQRVELDSARLELLPEWQRASAKLKPKRRSRSECKELGDHRGVLTLEVPSVGGGEVKRIDCVTPVFNGESFRVKLDRAMVEHVLSYIVSKGFDNTLKKQSRDPCIPKGVFKRGSKFVVGFNKSPSFKRYKTVGSIEEAVQVLGDTGGDDAIVGQLPVVDGDVEDPVSGNA